MVQHDYKRRTDKPHDWPLIVGVGLAVIFSLGCWYLSIKAILVIMHH